MTLEEYYQKRKECQEKEAKELALAYFNRFCSIPQEDLFLEFFWLYKDRTEPLSGLFDRMMRLTGNYDQSMEVYKNVKPLYKNFEDFLRGCGILK